MCRATATRRANIDTTAHHRRDIDTLPGADSHSDRIIHAFGDATGYGHCSSAFATTNTNRYARAEARLMRQLSVRE
jgi:hypothetical protein